METWNFGFNKPQPDDFYDVDAQNDNWDKLDEILKEITYGTEDLTPGTSKLDTGTLYFVYE